MINTITTDELNQKLSAQTDLRLIDVLTPESYNKKHLPSAINIPNSPDFAEKVNQAGISKDDEIIVYCSSAACGASPQAALILTKAGYKNVSHYKDGLAGWESAGLKFA